MKLDDKRHNNLADAAYMLLAYFAITGALFAFASGLSKLNDYIEYRQSKAQWGALYDHWESQIAADSND